jgi:hypothetical protein
VFGIHVHMRASPMKPPAEPRVLELSKAMIPSLLVYVTLGILILSRSEAKLQVTGPQTRLGGDL